MVVAGTRIVCFFVRMGNAAMNYHSTDPARPAWFERCQLFEYKRCISELTGAHTWAAPGGAVSPRLPFKLPLSTNYASSQPLFCTAKFVRTSIRVSTLVFDLCGYNQLHSFLLFPAKDRKELDQCSLVPVHQSLFIFVSVYSTSTYVRTPEYNSAAGQLSFRDG